MPKKTKVRRLYIHISLIMILSLGLNILILVGINCKRPEYLKDYRLNQSPDARHYVLLGTNFWTKGVYSRQSRSPYVPDIVRTPVYPLLAGLVQAKFGVIWPLYLIQAAISGVTGILIYLIATLFLPPGWALFAGLLYIGDFLILTLNNQAMSEIPFMLFYVLAITLWLYGYLFHPGSKIPSFFAGLALGLAIMTRPAVIYLPFILFALEICMTYLKNRNFNFMNPVILIICSYLVVAPWVIRNGKLFKINRLTTADSINLLYFAGAGAYQMKDGVTREEAQEKIIAEYNVVPLAQANNFWLAQKDVATMDVEQREAFWNIFRRYPIQLLSGSMTGIVKSLVIPNPIVGDLANFIGLTWESLGLNRFLKGSSSNFLKVARKNHPLLTLVFIWQTLLEVTALFLGLIGAANMLLDRKLTMLSTILLTIAAYHLATIAVVGPDAYSRHRIAIVPIIYIFAVYGCLLLVTRLKIFYKKRMRSVR